MKSIEHWADFLESRRWYGDRGRPLADVSTLDDAALADDLRWTLVDLRYRHGPAVVYQLPALVAAGGDAIEERPVSPRLTSWLHDGLVAGVQETRHGELLLRSLTPSGHELAGVATLVSGEMSNTLLRVGESRLVKIYRRIESGPHPEPEALEWLAARGFPHVPALHGVVSHRGAAGQEATLMIVGEYLEGATSLWDRFTARDDGAPDEACLVALADRLGEVTADLHRALEGAGGGEGPPTVRADAGVLDRLKRALPDLEPRARSLAGAVLARRWEIEERLRHAVDPGNAPTRIHGDYHLGQVVVAGPAERLAILDFEGEPVRPLASRRALAPAAVDVASLLRSFSYARHRGDGGRDVAWESRLRESFLDSYCRCIAGAAFVPSASGALVKAVIHLELEKALAEIRYELGHRPEWTWIPLRGLLDIVDRD